MRCEVHESAGQDLRCRTIRCAGTRGASASSPPRQRCYPGATPARGAVSTSGGKPAVARHGDPGIRAVVRRHFVEQVGRAHDQLPGLQLQVEIAHDKGLSQTLIGQIHKRIGSGARVEQAQQSATGCARRISAVLHAIHRRPRGQRVIVCDEITGTARDMEPGVVVEAQAGKFFGRHFRCCHGDTKHRFEHEFAQFLNARLRPGKEIEAALEHLCLRVVRRRGVSILLCLPGQKQLFELAIQSIAGLQPGVADGHSESGGELHEPPYPYRLSLALGSMNRIIANTRISEVTDRTTDTSCGTCAGKSAIQPGTGDQV